MSNLLNIKDQSGNWIPIPVVTNGIKSITQNEDYTLTITLNDGTTYTTTSIKGEDGQDYILTEQDKQDIAGLVDTPVDDVQINGQSIVENGVANVPIADGNTAGVAKINPYFGIGIFNGQLMLNAAQISDIKNANTSTKAVSTVFQHASTFYGLAKASGDKTQSQSDNPVGTYTNEAKASIKNMLGVEDVDIDSKAPVITETATGSIVSFDDGADDMPLQSLIVDINPVQDLHGYDSPWPAGGGVNKFPGASHIGGGKSYGLTWIPQEDGGMEISGTVTDATWLYRDRYIDLENFYGFSIGDTIAVSGKDTAGNYMTALHFYNGSTLLATVVNGKSVVIPEGTTRARLLVYAKGSAPGVVGETINNTVYMQIESGSTATAWTPYENICPISGWTGMQIQHDGKNLLPLNIWNGFNYNASVGKVFTPTMSDKSWTQGESSITYETTATYTTLSLMTPLLHKGTYHLGLHELSTNSLRYSRYTLDKSFTVKQSDYISNVTNVSVTITLDEDGYIAFYLDNGSTASQTVEITIQVEVGNTESPYEPYTGRSITIDLGQTVYGGTLDVVTGKLTLTNYFCTPDNAKRITYGIDAQSNLPYAFFSFVQSGSAVALSSRTLCSMYKAGTTSNIDKALRMWTSGAEIWDSDLDVTSLDTVKAYFADLMIVYPLATPIEIQLDVHTLNSLYGINSIFADTGNVNVKYRADTELYIDKQISDVPVQDIQINGTSVVSDGVANVPMASANELGAVSVNGSYYGVSINPQDGGLYLSGATDSAIKAGNATYRVIFPSKQHIAAFYGLAKAAGDTTQSSSSNAVGTYTDSAKTAIKNMLGVIDGGGTISETITGTDPTITAQNNFRYMCGELYTLNFTPCVSGVCEVIFTSGATPTVLTLPDTVRMPAWWTGVEANTTYEISIVDGVYGAVMSWS